ATQAPGTVPRPGGRHSMTVPVLSLTPGQITAWGRGHQPEPSSSSPPYVYGKTWDQARDRLVEEQSKVVRGIPFAAESWKLGPYLDHSLENVVKPTQRAATYATDETYTRLYLKPGLGHHRLRRLSVANVQRFLNIKLAEGQSVRNVQLMRQVLSAALTRAAREELISRNVARLAELPAREPSEVRPWSGDEALSS